MIFELDSVDEKRLVREQSEVIEILDRSEFGRTKMIVPHTSLAVELGERAASVPQEQNLFEALGGMNGQRTPVGRRSVAESAKQTLGTGMRRVGRLDDSPSIAERRADLALGRFRDPFSRQFEQGRGIGASESEQFAKCDTV